MDVAIKAITLTRDNLKNIIMRSIFDEAVKGCFVRISANDMKTNKNFYIFAEIMEVKLGPLYDLAGLKTNKWLILRNGP